MTSGHDNGSFAVSKPRPWTSVRLLPWLQENGYPLVNLLVRPEFASPKYFGRNPFALLLVVVPLKEQLGFLDEVCPDHEGNFRNLPVPGPRKTTSLGHLAQPFPSTRLKFAGNIF